jgi:hypothetical protein
VKQKYLRLLLDGFAVLSLLLGYAQPGTVFAQAQQGNVDSTIRQYLCAPSDPGKTNNSDLYDCINKLYRFAIVISVVAGVALVVYAGYLYMAGTTTSISQAKNIISNTIVAIVILLGAFLFLKQINPELIKFKPLTAIVVDAPTNSLNPNSGNFFDPLHPDGNPKPGELVSPAGHKPEELTSAGCAFQGSKAGEVPNMAEALFQKVKAICLAVSTKKGSDGKPLIPTISSISSGGHVDGSFHFKGCAVDFAGNDPQFTLNDTGKAIIAAAKSLGMTINPGSDASQTNHVHVDVRDGCK